MRHTVFLALALLAPSALGAPSWRGQIIYQVMPDRFSDGDPRNDTLVDETDPRAWHGGDLRGLTGKLGYIQDLGATAVWLTPIYAQMDGMVGGARGYHGYWPQDFKNVDPHFGTLDDFRAFVKSAHAGGLKVMLDQVINHFGYTAPTVEDKPDWFHDSATCKAKGNDDVYCPIFGLPDLAQENLQVRDFLFDNDDFWRRQGVDAYRYDAIKNVPQDFLGALLARDKRTGTFTLGEYYGADAATVAEYQRLGFSSLFDFALQSAMQASVMGGQGLDRVRGALSRLSALSDPDDVALFLDNHDLPRFANGSPFEDVGRERTKYGLRALMTLRGIPVIWQGTEIAMRGGADPDNRRDMRFPAQWTPEERAVFEVAKRAIAARKASPALSGGDLTLLPVPAKLADDLLLFTRQLGAEKVLVAWHNGRARQSYSLKSPLVTDLPVQLDLFGQDAKLSSGNGYLNLSLPPQTAAVFKLN